MGVGVGGVGGGVKLVSCTVFHSKKRNRERIQNRKWRNRRVCSRKSHRRRRQDWSGGSQSRISGKKNKMKSLKVKFSNKVNIRLG